MSFVTFGEIMLRLTPSEHGTKLCDARNYAAHFAGSESNVASSLAVLGNKVKFVSKLPSNHLGDAAIRSLNYFGIDTSSVARGGPRLGTYFIEQGSSIRPSFVVYDRAGSSITAIKHGEIDWQPILAGKSWVFVSGITPALSDACATETLHLVRTASELGVKVCFDFNFRRSLWKNENAAENIFTGILEYTDLLCGNAGSLSDVFKIYFDGESETEKTAAALDFASANFSVPMIAFTVREQTSASQNKLSGLLKISQRVFASARYVIDIADRFGTGDAFAAALLHALQHNWDHERCIQFATAALALKHTMRGDQHTSSEHEIISIMNGNVAGHVIR